MAPILHGEKLVWGVVYIFFARYLAEILGGNLKK